MADVIVAFASETRQVELTLELNRGDTVRDVILRSGVLDQFPEIDLSINKTGIYSHLCSLDDEPRPGDRIEIYRPLKIDPKTARRKRANG